MIPILWCFCAEGGWERNPLLLSQSGMFHDLDLITQEMTHPSRKGCYALGEVCAWEVFLVWPWPLFFCAICVFFPLSCSPPVPSLQSETIKSLLSGHCASLSSRPCPLLLQTFWLPWPLSLYHQSPSRYSRQRGAQLLLYPELSEDESRNSGNTGCPWQRKCPLHGSLLTDLFQDRPVVLISEGRVLCKPSSHWVLLPAPSSRSHECSPPTCLVCEIC